MPEDPSITLKMPRTRISICRQQISRSLLPGLSLMILLFSSMSQATLITVGSGLVNDSDLNVTWLRDANTFFTQSGSGSNPVQAANLVNTIIAAMPTVTDDAGNHSITSADFNTNNGQMTWWGAQAWVGYLNSINHEGFHDWRLPVLRPVDGIAFNYSFSCDGTTDYGKNNTTVNATASELGHVFYNELNNLADTASDPACTLRSGGYGVTNSGPFINLQNGVYWFGTSYPLYFGNAWHFHTFNGGQGNDYKGDFFYVWAVRAGQTINTNLALNKTATASSAESGSTQAAAAVDGNPATRWSSAYSDTAWLQVDLGAPYSINRVKLIWEAAFGRAYQIQVSTNGTAWNTLYTQADGTGGTEDLTNLQGTGRYIRLQGVTRGTAWGYSLYEMEVYGGLASGVGVTSPGPQNTVLDSPVSLQITAADANVPPLALTYSATGLPLGLAIDSISGLISGSPTMVPSPNPATVTVTASNAHGSDSATFSWAVTASPNTTNIALNQPASASSSETMAFSATAAVDGNPATRWSSAYSDTAWLQVDLGALYSINRVKLIWEAAFGRAYQIQVSTNGTAWNTLYTQADGTGGTEDLTNLQGTGRYIRLQGVTRGTAWGYSLYEMEVYGDLASGVAITNPGSQSSVLNSPISLQIAGMDSSSSPLPLTYGATGLPNGLSIQPTGAHAGLITGSPTTLGTSPTVTVTATNTNGTASTTFGWTVTAPSSTTNVALNQTAVSSSAEADAFPAALAFDGDLGTRWSSAYANTEWLQVDLGASHTINRVKLVWEAAYGRAYQIQVSTDGTTWTTIYTQTNGTGGTEDIANLQGTGRYVRLQGMTRGTAWGYSLYEMEVYGN